MAVKYSNTVIKYNICPFQGHPKLGIFGTKINHLADLTGEIETGQSVEICLAKTRAHIKVTML
jgi:hypothetical protein